MLLIVLLLEEANKSIRAQIFFALVVYNVYNHPRNSDGYYYIMDKIRKYLMAKYLCRHEKIFLLIALKIQETER